jgi:hypothetical protein
MRGYCEGCTNLLEIFYIVCRGIYYNSDMGIFVRGGEAIVTVQIFTNKEINGIELFSTEVVVNLVI